MRSYQPYSRRPGTSSLLLGGMLLTLLVGGGLLGTLWLLGVDLNPFARSGPAEDPFQVRIPINSQPIPAYTRVDRVHLLNPRNGSLSYQPLPPSAAVGMSIRGVDVQGSQVESLVESVRRDGDEVVFVTAQGNEVPHSQTQELGGAIMSVSSLIGRVVRRDKTMGLGFTEGNFFPQGTPEGLAGATPEGMRAVTLDATKLIGVHALNAGDKIDLIASISDSLIAEVGGGGNDHKSQASGSDAGVEPVLLAQNAVVLKPVYVRNEAATSASLTQGTRVQNIPKYEVAIAVQPDDVIGLQGALNRALQITCVVHSMRPSSSSESVALVTTPDELTVPVTVRPIYAYAVVARDAFVSPATRTLKLEKLSRQQVDREGIITSLEEMLGAVTRQDIPAGRYLRRSDLLNGPPGSEVDAGQSISPLDARVTHSTTTLVQQHDHSHDGPAAGRTIPARQSSATSGPPAATAVGDRPALTRFIPAGRTALAIPWNRVYSAEHLQIGDRIDLLVSYSLQQQMEVDETETRPDGTVIVRRSESLSPQETERSWDESFGFRAEPWFVATDAIVIAPVGYPAPAAALRALGEQANRSTSQGAIGGPPVIVAVDERDVEAVATVISTPGAVFTVAFRGGEGSGPKISPDSKEIVVAPEPLPPYQAINEQGWKGHRRRLASRIVRRDDPRFETAITASEFSNFYGRVLAVSKTLGEHFTEADFLPVGAKPGLAAAVRQGYTLVPVADRDLLGIDNLETEDRIAIIRAGNNALSGDATFASSIGAAQHVANAILPSVRIARRSMAGQTVLEIRADQVARLQAALFESRQDDQYQLIAIGLPREMADPQGARDQAVTDIRSFDPLENVSVTEFYIGGQRTQRYFLGGTP